MRSNPGVRRELSKSGRPSVATCDAKVHLTRRVLTRDIPSEDELRLSDRRRSAQHGCESRGSAGKQARSQRLLERATPTVGFIDGRGREEVGARVRGGT